MNGTKVSHLINALVTVLVGGLVGVIAFTVFLTYYNEWNSRRRHATEIEQAFNQKLIPAAAFVRNFWEREHRLPSDDEMRAGGWHHPPIVQIYRERPQWQKEWGVDGKDFILGTEVPAWNLYFQSWDNKRIEANWP